MAISLVNALKAGLVVLHAIDNSPLTQGWREGVRPPG